MVYLAYFSFLNYFILFYFKHIWLIFHAALNLELFGLALTQTHYRLTTVTRIPKDGIGLGTTLTQFQQFFLCFIFSNFEVKFPKP